MPGPCAKAQVVCLLYAKDGQIVGGSNDCENPQEKCPRLPGEGYEKCKTVCRQAGHAEVRAIENAKQLGVDLYGARALLIGHTHYCPECQHALFKAGVKWLGVNPTPSPTNSTRSA